MLGSSQNCQEGWGYDKPVAPGPQAGSGPRKSLAWYSGHCFPGFSQPLALESGRNLSLAEVRPLSVGYQAPHREQVAGIFGYYSRASPSLQDSPRGRLPSTGRMLKSDKYPLPCAFLIPKTAWGQPTPGAS